jgi:predicted HTH transcriptional regulator
VRDKTVLMVDVPLSTSRPHYLRSKGLDNGTYVRLGSTNRKADASLIADIERSARGLRFEDIPDSRATLADLDLSVLPAIDGRAVTEADLVPLGLATRQGDSLVPTNAGLLAASVRPDRFLPSAWVQCGRIRGPQRTDIVDQTEYHGPIPGAVEPVMDFLRKNAFLAAEFGQARRKDVWSIPIEPLREVIVNALVHANYAEPGTPIRVVFYDDRIEVEGPGLLVAGMTIPDMRSASRLRNPSLARIFRAAGLMENFGTGVRRVYEQLAADGLPEPKIEEIVDRIRVTVYIQSHAPQPGPKTSDKRPAGPPSGQVSKLSEQVGKISEQVRILLTIAAEVPRSRGEMLQAIGLTDAYGNYRRHLVPLLEQGYLARTVPDRPNSRNQRYITTSDGRQLLEEGTQ